MVAAPVLNEGRDGTKLTAVIPAKYRASRDRRAPNFTSTLPGSPIPDQVGDDDRKIGNLTPRLQVLRVVERRVANACHLNRIALGEILHLQLAADLRILLRQIGKDDVLANRRAVGN